jgi:hypothetical protein
VTVPVPMGRSLSITTLGEWICKDTSFARDAVVPPSDDLGFVARLRPMPSPKS